ncbi:MULTISPECIES: succinylglutamate desuccinylase/aspartoacylase family protein [unclassified Mesorhizobium]|uniref:succinylglutamate desuccinylase/aspartoacylase family protein n=1 Tax=unclassified Mesorhizobium TaxID=325217 RepID=UPI001FDEE07A|nr:MULTISPECIES: succinylglutamate desuccinylase/aspartoacylase family protein [unclassified Mesorhizobium]
MNPPAIQAWSRNTPIDGLNLNRSFPGGIEGSLTERIADAVSHLLLADYISICTAVGRRGIFRRLPITQSVHTSARLNAP